MGAKLANLHIQTTSMNEVTDNIKKMKSSNSYYVGAFGNWVSVFGNHYNWETIGEDAVALSALLKYPVFSVGYFDDDVLEIALFQDNHLITKHVAGEDIEECYGIENETMDINLFNESLNLPIENAEIASILNKDDLSEIVEELGDALNLPLWNKYDWIEDNDELKDKFNLVHIIAMQDKSTLNQNENIEKKIIILSNENSLLTTEQLLDRFLEHKLLFRLSKSKLPIKSNKSTKETMVLLPMTFEMLMIFEFANEEDLSLEKEIINKKALKLDRESEFYGLEEDNVFLVYLKQKERGMKTYEKLREIFQCSD